MSGYSPILELGDDPHHLTPREKVENALYSMEDWRHASPEYLIENILTALASGSGDHAELARLAVVATDAASLGDGLQEAALTRFQAHANPVAVLALLAENAALREQVKFEKQVAYDENDRWQEAERKLAEAERGAEFVARLLPSAAGLDDAPDNKVVAVYINMRELRQARSILSKEAERG